MKYKITLLFFLLLCLSNAIWAQKATLSGKITGDRTPVPGATIKILNSTKGTAADESGNYRLTDLAAGSVTIEVSSVGFANKTETLTLKDGDNTLDIALSESTEFLGEVVVTGLSVNTKQKEQGTSRAGINGATIDRLPNSSIEEAMVGRMAGVEAYSTDGAPGGGFRFRIRGPNSVLGASEPLVIIDGIIMDNSNRNTTTGATGGSQATGSASFGMNNGTRGLMAVNPEDIESIEVLKGAAAASLYGSRASSGVLVIKTKSGGKGGIHLDYALDIGTTEVSKNIAKYKTAWTGAEIDQWAGFVNPTKTIYTDAVLGAYKNNPQTDWSLGGFRKGSFTRHTVRAQGGNKMLGFYATVSTQENIGQVKGTDFNADGARLSLSSSPINGLNIKISGDYSKDIRNQLPGGTPGFFIPNRWMTDGLVMPFMTLDTGVNSIKNVYFGLTTPDKYATIQRTANTERLVLSANVNYKITPDLAIDINAGKDNSTIDSKTLYQFGLVTLFPLGRLDVDREKLNQQSLTVGLNHSWRINDKMYLKSAIGTQYDENNRFYYYHRTGTLKPDKRSTDAAVQLANSLDTVNYSAYLPGSFFETNPVVKTFGIYFNETFGLNEKLFLNLGGRFDRSTAFVNQYFFYPRASLSYQATKNLRARAAFGSSGTQPPPYLATLTFRREAGGYQGSGGNYTADNPPNPNLSPEKQTEIELGIDGSFLNDRLTVEATFYNKNFSNLLLNAPINPALNYGLTSGIRNIGQMYNRGFEFVIGLDVVKNQNLTWNVTLTGSTLKNEVTKLTDPPTPIAGGVDNIMQIREGYPISGIWASVSNIAGATDVSRKFLGTTLPTSEGNIRTDLTWKDLSLNVMFGGKFGMKRFNSTARDLANPTKRQHADYWNLPQADLVALYADQNKWVEDASFIKLRQLTIAYNIPSKLLKKVRLNKANISLTGMNLFTSTKYIGGYDIESETSGSGSQNAWVRGLDSWEGGMPKTYTLSFNVGF
jgi:TonB-dependent starch-binding outer membrane protein SusC